MAHYAFTNGAGVIGFGHHMPAGVLHIADDPSHERLYEAVEMLAQRAADGETMLVPGIPEAETNDQAMEALIAFRRLVMRDLAKEATR